MTKLGKIVGLAVGFAGMALSANADTAPYRYQASALEIRGAFAAGDRIDLKAPDKTSVVILHDIPVVGVDVKRQTYLLLQLTPDQIKTLKSAEHQYGGSLSVVLLAAAKAPDDRVVMLIEAHIKPERRDEFAEAVHHYLPLVRAEPGVEAFYVATRQDDPNTVVFYEIYKSKAAQDFHLQQDFTKTFLATLKDAQAGDRSRTPLIALH